MPKRISLIAGAALAMLVIATSATAVGHRASTSAGATASAAPFAQSWAQVPRTSAARQAKDILVFGQEQDIVGFNAALTCCSQFWSAVQAVPVIRGTYNVDNKLRHILDLVSSAKATKTTLSYTIRPDANWNWGGKKIPVTYKDFVYTWQAFVDPKNDVVGRDGYDQITGYTHKGAKQITFKWKKPYAAWQDIFGVIYPSQALAGLDFNKIWTNCICGNDGKPISDGPFILTNYTNGQGSTFKVNPFWYGKKPKLKEVDFKIITDTNTEVQAMRGGEVDAINPTFGINLLPLKSTPGVTFNQVPGLYQEHIDIQFGPKGQPLLRSPWMRQALMMGIDRAVDHQDGLRRAGGQHEAARQPRVLPGRRVVQDRLREVELQPGEVARAAEEALHRRPVVSVVGQLDDVRRAPASRRSSASRGRRRTQRARRRRRSSRRSSRASASRSSMRRCRRTSSSGRPASRASNYDLANFAWVTAADPAGFVPTGVAVARRTTSTTATGRRRGCSRHRTASSIRRSGRRSSSRRTR